MPRWVPLALLAVAAVGGALFLWPRETHAPPRLFESPGLFSLEHPDGEGRPEDLVLIQRRLQARDRIDVVFSLPDIAAFELDDADGVFELLLGDRAQRWCSMVVLEDKLRMSTGWGEQLDQRVLLDRPRAAQLGVGYSDGRAWVLVDGERLGEGLECPAPAGFSRVGFWRRASVRALRITTLDGDLRLLSAGLGEP